MRSVTAMENSRIESRHSWLRSCHFLTLLAPILTTTTAVRANDPIAHEEFRQRLQPGWAWLHNMDEARKTYEVIHEKQLGARVPKGILQRPPSRTRVSVDWANRYRLAAKLESETPGRSQVYGRNPFYAFVTIKEDEQKEWKLQAMKEKRPEDNPIDQLMVSCPNRSYFYPLSSTPWDSPLLTSSATRALRSITLTKRATAE